MHYTIYILYSYKYRKTYIGYISNLLERFKSHNSLARTGWTAKLRPWKVIYCEYYTDKSLAIKREAELKSGKGREWLKRKIQSELAENGFLSA